MSKKLTIAITGRALKVKDNASSTRMSVRKNKSTKSKKKSKQNQPRRKLTTEEKIVILYPDIASKNKQDRVLGKFISAHSRDPFQGKEIQPDLLEFNFPDFGFENELCFISDDPNQKISPNWKYFMDYCSPFPKFERLNNYINFANNEKLERLMSEEAKLSNKPSKQMS